MRLMTHSIGRKLVTPILPPVAGIEVALAPALPPLEDAVGLDRVEGHDKKRFEPGVLPFALRVLVRELGHCLGDAPSQSADDFEMIH